MALDGAIEIGCFELFVYSLYPKKEFKCNEVF